jgi:pimeloyl-ACP methyl ester carboxylesterase
MITDFTSHTINLCGDAIHYRRLEAGRSETLLCLHGFKDCSTSFETLAQHLSVRFNVVIPDWIGHGKSARLGCRPCGRAALLGLLAAFAARVMPARYVLLGHSMGAGFAVDYCGFFPDEILALILLEGVAPPDDAETRVASMKAWLEGLRTTNYASIKRPIFTRDAARASLKFRNSRLSADSLDELVSNYTAEIVDGAFTWHFDPMLDVCLAPDYLSQPVRRYLCAHIACPTIGLYGEDSYHWRGTVRPERIAPKLDDLPDSVTELLAPFGTAKVEIIPESGHNLHREAPAYVASRILHLLPLTAGGH